MIKALAHVCIHSSDLDKTKAFYCDVLGMNIQFKFIREDKLFGFYLNAGNQSFIEVFASDDIQDVGNIKHLCLEVEDIDKLEQHLSENGVKCWGKQLAGDHSWQLWCKDPDGVDIEFHQYTEKSTQLTGEDCIVNW